MISRFLSDLTDELNKELPGIEAHKEMISISRKSADVIRQLNVNPRESAVLILLYQDDDQWHFPLIKRQEYDGVHSKQIALPGGQVDKDDKDLEATSIRETMEELGVDPSNIEILGSLTEIYIPPSNFLVRPYVGYLNKFTGFEPDIVEVNRVIPTSLPSFIELPIKKMEKYVRDGNITTQVSSFIIDNEVVWGATAMMLNEFKGVLKKIVK